MQYGPRSQCDMRAGDASARYHRPSFRRVAPPSYRVEWRRPANGLDGKALFDLRFETAIDPAALRMFVLRVGDAAFGSEFRIRAPDGTAVFTTLEAVDAWHPLEELLPRDDRATIWDADRRHHAHVDEMLTSVRAATRLGIRHGVLTMRAALHVVKMTEALVQRRGE